MSQDPVAMRALGEDPGEFDRVESAVFTTAAGHEPSAGRTGELEAEGLAVSAGPLRHDVGDQASVMARVGIEVRAGRLRQSRRGASTRRG